MHRIQDTRHNRQEYGKSMIKVCDYEITVIFTMKEKVKFDYISVIENFFQATLAKNVKKLLKNKNGNDAFQIVLKNNNVLRWKDEGACNCTLIYWAVVENQSDFLQQLLNNEKVCPQFNYLNIYNDKENYGSFCLNHSLNV